MKVREAAFITCVFTLDVDSTTAPEFIDITDRVNKAVEQSQVQNGLAIVYSKHTTAAVKIQENEPLLIQDMTRLLERLAPRDGHYGHNDFSVRTVHMQEDECPNGHSHCQHIALGTSESIPIVDGALTLGRYQSIFMVELDEQKHQREILVQVIGV